MAHLETSRCCSTLTYQPGDDVEACGARRACNPSCLDVLGQECLRWDDGTPNKVIIWYSTMGPKGFCKTPLGFGKCCTINKPYKYPTWDGTVPYIVGISCIVGSIMTPVVRKNVKRWWILAGDFVFLKRITIYVTLKGWFNMVNENCWRNFDP